MTLVKLIRLMRGLQERVVLLDEAILEMAKQLNDLKAQNVTKQKRPYRRRADSQD